MKVKELRDFIGSLPDDMPVCVFEPSRESGSDHYVSDIRVSRQTVPQCEAFSYYWGCDGELVEILTIE